MIKRVKIRRLTLDGPLLLSYIQPRYKIELVCHDLNILVTQFVTVTAALRYMLYLVTLFSVGKYIKVDIRTV